MQGDLTIDGDLVSADLVEARHDPATAGSGRAGLSAILRLPAEWVVREFADYALNEDRIELVTDHVAAWFGPHLRRHPEDILVLIAMVRQAGNPPKRRGLFGGFGKREAEDEPLWRWVATDAVKLDGDVLVIEGECLGIGG